MNLEHTTHIERRNPVPKTEFIVSPQYEICPALAALAEPEPPLHGDWCRAARGCLGRATADGIAAYGGLLVERLFAADGAEDRTAMGGQAS